MTNYPSPDIAIFSEENKYDMGDDETDISAVLKRSVSFPGEQYFNEIMFEKMRPKKVAKFRASRKSVGDL